MTHQEYNTLMRIIELKAERAVRTVLDQDQDVAALEEDIDELVSVLRAHIVEGE